MIMLKYVILNLGITKYQTNTLKQIKLYNKNRVLLFNYLINITLILTTFVYIFEEKFILLANRKKSMVPKF